MVFIIDLPKLPEVQFDQNIFHAELTRFCAHIGIDQEIVGDMSNYDFSAARDMAFIHSIGGSHAKKDWKYTGISGLARAVRKLGLASGKGLEIDYVVSELLV